MDKKSHGGKGSNRDFYLTQLNLSLQMSPPPSSFSEPRSGGGSGGPLSHFYSGSPTSYFTSGLQAGLKQSHLNKVSLPYRNWSPGTIGMLDPVYLYMSSLPCHPRGLSHSSIGGRAQSCSCCRVMAPLVPTVQLPFISLV